jgi:hypothetical protein
MCRNVRSIEWHQKTYHEISWDYPFNVGWAAGFEPELVKLHKKTKIRSSEWEPHHIALCSSCSADSSCSPQIGYNNGTINYTVFQVVILHIFADGLEPKPHQTSTWSQIHVKMMWLCSVEFWIRWDPDYFSGSCLGFRSDPIVQGTVSWDFQP